MRVSSHFHGKHIMPPTYSRRRLALKRRRRCSPHRVRSAQPGPDVPQLSPDVRAHRERIASIRAPPPPPQPRVTFAPFGSPAESDQKLIVYPVIVPGAAGPQPPPVGTRILSKMANRNRFDSCELSGNHAPTRMGDTLRRIKMGGNRDSCVAAHWPQAVARFAAVGAGFLHATRFPATERRIAGALSFPVPRSGDGQVGPCAIQSRAHRDWYAVCGMGALRATRDSCASQSGVQPVASTDIVDRADRRHQQQTPPERGLCWR